MKTFAKIKLFSFLVFGLLFLVIGISMHISGKWLPGSVMAFILAGTGQIVIFNVLFFILYKDRIRERLKK